ncbi:MAG: phosphoribosylformylglycinamidine synthase subunit PurQ [Proteobacteria bacterium]|nr:phosphoribosylformylglycinamidine synthase subunit PurQ [Pseudomonadota bacterium]
MRVAVVVFPGTNCEQDVEHVYAGLLKQEVLPIWHRDTDLKGADLVVLPGGFSYGDYLRTGALAKLSPVMRSVRAHAEAGGRVLGICNGFQILCEAGLLPGVLLENVGRRFLSRFINMRVESTASFFTQGLTPGAVITCPIAHFQGNYFAEPATLEELESHGQVVFRYCDATGEVSPHDVTVNVNGSCRAIAGISSRNGNVVGLMPHPERAVEALIGFVGGASGLRPFLDNK